MALTRDKQDELLELIIVLLRIQDAGIRPETKRKLMLAWKDAVERAFPVGYDRMSVTVAEILRAKDRAEIERILEVA